MHPLWRTGATAALLALAGAGCITTEEEARHERAMERLDGDLPQELDRRLERWSAAAGEANRVSADVYRLRLERMLQDSDTLFAVRTGLLVSDPTVVATCAAALGFARQKGVGVDLLPLLSHERGKVRQNAATALYLLGGADCPIGDAMALLGDDDAGVRESGALLAARVLRRQAERIEKAPARTAPSTEDEAYYGAMLSYFEALSDPDSQVRANVADGLGIIGNEGAAPLLVERGLQDPDPKVRYATAQAIRSLRPTSEAEGVLGSLKREFNDRVKRELHGALRAITGLDIGSVEEWERRIPEWRAEREKAAKGAAPRQPAQPVQPTPPGGGK